MTQHTMKLRPEPFEKIKMGRKTIELRLYDEKRQRIAIGDTIQFMNTEDTADVLSATVKGLHLFASFEQLYSSLPLTECGYAEEELSTASHRDMEQYYSEEEQSRYGVVGIKIALHREEA
ncbi:MAG: ASCH domain-containing protein [Oscillospiraceae bacterium]|nr:ASCH domain-containing protein [Oscillospiraceae bacterium]